MSSNHAADKARLFFALWPDESLRDALAALQAEWIWPARAAPVARERLHMTLHFLGDLPRACLADLKEAAHLAFTPFDLLLVETGLWSSNGVAWVRAPFAPDPLLELHAQLGKALQRLGLSVEKRRFEPHVTLARRAVRAEPPAQMTPIHWPVRGFVLVESDLRPPARYRVLSEYR
jgi:2'-5' RNA ligase